MNLLNSISRTNQNSNSNKAEKPISHKNSANDFLRTSSYDEENNPSNFYDNYNISEHHKERASPDFLMGENLIDTKIPIHYQSPPNGPESDHFKRNRNSNSNTNIDKLNFHSALYVGNYLNSSVSGCANYNGNVNEKYSNKTLNELSISKNNNTIKENNNTIKENNHKNIDFQIDKKNVNNVNYKSFLTPNTNSIIPNQIIIQPDLISNYSQNLQYNNNKSDSQLNKNDNNNAYKVTNPRQNGNTNTLTNKDNSNISKIEFPEKSLGLKFSNSNDISAENRNKLNNKDNLSTNEAIYVKQNEINDEKPIIKKRNLVKIFGKSILSVIISFILKLNFFLNF